MVGITVVYTSLLASLLRWVIPGYMTPFYTRFTVGLIPVLKPRLL